MMSEKKLDRFMNAIELGLLGTWIAVAIINGPGMYDFIGMSVIAVSSIIRNMVQ